MTTNQNTNEDTQRTFIDHPVKSEEKQLKTFYHSMNRMTAKMIADQNEQEDQFLPEIIFEPLRSLLSDIIQQNKQLKEEINQCREHCQKGLPVDINALKKHDPSQSKYYEEQTKKNEDLQLKINQIEEQSQLRYEHLLERLKYITGLYEECKNELNEQVKKNEDLQRVLLQVNEKSDEHQNSIDENPNSQILETNQRHRRLEINIKASRPVLNYFPYTKWKQDGITIAGGYGRGNQLNQLDHAIGISVDDDRTTYIVDYGNRRILEWKYNAAHGEVVAVGDREEAQINQSYHPRDVIIDKETDSLIFSDEGNRRVVRQSRQNDLDRQVIASNIDCSSLIMDKDGSLYVFDWKKSEVRRWRRGEESDGTIVAGGSGQGDQFNQFSSPSFTFVDDDYSLYISDWKNNRVMKWMRGATEGMIVAGGNGRGSSLTQLHYPMGVVVDQLGQIYVADWGNHRVMRWCRGAKEGSVIVGGNGQGQQSNQLHYPTGLSFDGEGNLYVVDRGNDRIQKFEIDFQ